MQKRQKKGQSTHPNQGGDPMVKVTYDRVLHRLTAVGHAGKGKQGHDLVCAAVSALVMTLAGNVASLATQDGLRRQELKLAEGDACISCLPYPRMRAVTTLIFDTVCSGFELLETLYPENIKFTVIA